LDFDTPEKLCYLITQAKIRSFLANPTHRKRIFTILKVLILALLTWAIYQQVFQRKDLGAVLSGFREHFRWENAGWILLALALMPLNWGLETFKWRYLLQPTLSLSFGEAVRSILAGISVSLFTPNRIGEYGGRLLLIPASHSWLALSATFVGSVAQWVVLLLAGCWGVLTVGLDLWPQMAGYYSDYGRLLWGAVLLLPILYIRMGRVADWLKRLKWLNKLKEHQRKQLRSGLQSYKSDKLFWVLLMALGRYVIYSSQYLFFLYGFGFEMDPVLALAGIATIFLVQSSVPMPPFMALVARGELALLMWSEYGANELVILASTFSLFIINLIVPALLGGAAIVKTK
jgi:hypothetical protein